MNKRKKILSFTLIELLVAISLSSIVVILALTAFIYLQKIINVSNKRITKINNTIMFVSNIKNDFENAHVIRIRDKSLHIENEYGANIIYDFKDSMMVRKKSGQIFNYSIKVKDISYSLFDESKGYIKDFKFKIFDNDFNEIPVFIKKEYYSDILVNL